MIVKFVCNKVSKVFEEKIDEIIDKKLYEKIKTTDEIEKIAKQMSRKFTHESEF